MPIVNSTREMTIVAHQDDDLLFMNPDIQDGITAGREVTVVYVTAGDAGEDQGYWGGREIGVKAAYGAMAGATGWVDEVVSISHGGTTYEIQSSYLIGAPQIRLYFVRLPDGGENGLPRYNFESLAQLEDGRISEISTVDGAATYDRAQVVGLLTGLLEHHQPDQIRVQDHETAFAAGEHRDHFNTSIFTDEAIADYSGSLYSVTSYVHYGTSELRQNLDTQTRDQTLDTFLEYADFDEYVFESAGQLLPLYSSWVGRQYVASETTVAPALTASISGRYFFETANQGIEGAGDQGMSGATVYLWDQSMGQVIATARTALDGTYSFYNMPVDSDYRVLFQDPSTLGGAFISYGFSDAGQGGNEATDSDVTFTMANGAGGTGLFAVGTGQSVTNIDAAIYNAYPSSLSGRVFLDADGNGLRSDTEAGISGVTVGLMNTTTNTQVASTTTNGAGIYQFDNVLPGQSYAVYFANPNDLSGALANYVFTAGNLGSNDTIDSDVTRQLPDGRGATNSVDLAIGQSITTLDAGLMDPMSASVSGRYFLDTNGNGLEDSDEDGLAGATVTLYDTARYLVMGSATTNADGRYQIDGVAPSDDYVLRFDYGAALPDGFEQHRFTTGNTGSDNTIDSDVTRLNYLGQGETDVFSVGSSQTLTNMDAGLRPPSPASVSGRYFVDHNGNGLDDGGEGLANATVTLMRGETQIAVTNSDADGGYAFDNLSFGDDYFVIFEAAQFVTDAPNNGYVQAGIGGDLGIASLDSHVTEVLQFGNGATSRFTLSPGQDLQDVNAGLNGFDGPWTDDGVWVF